MTDRGFDVAIVGASIAGCTTATLLGRQGARVALVESHSDPTAFKRVCTHAIQASAGPTLGRLGVLDTVARVGMRSEFHAWSRYGWIAPTRAYTERLESTGHYALNLRRETFDPMLRRLAAGTDGVELMLGHTATGLRRQRGRIAGLSVRDRDGGELELRAKLVVGADGRGSGVAALAGLRTKVRVNNRFVYFGYYRDTPLVSGSSSQVWFTDPDMAYAFPTDSGLTLLACLPHKRRLAEFRRDPEAAMARTFAPLPDAPRLDPAKRESKLIGKLDMPNERRAPAAAGVALVGDAALAADPLWGVGCGWALQSGEWLAEAAGPALGDAGELDRALEGYARRHRRALAGHDRVCSAFSRARRLNPLERLFFRAAARDDEVAGRVALFSERWLRPLQVWTPRALGQVVRANLS
jgi:2-polyprenyl-6-methoxyphenol hydroxylase-like FAD-dependent oxidoreductase